MLYAIYLSYFSKVKSTFLRFHYITYCTLRFLWGSSKHGSNALWWSTSSYITKSTKVIYNKQYRFTDQSKTRNMYLDQNYVLNNIDSTFYRNASLVFVKRRLKGSYNITKSTNIIIYNKKNTDLQRTHKSKSLMMLQTYLITCKEFLFTKKICKTFESIWNICDVSLLVFFL